MNPEIMAVLNALVGFLGGGSAATGGMGVSSGIASSNPAFNVAGSSGGPMDWVRALINLLVGGTTAYGASRYGSQALTNQQQLWDLQKQAIRQALGLRTGNLAQQAVQNAMPLDRRLAYTVSQAADQGTALRGMSQSPGAVAAGEAQALAPYAERNLELGANLALGGNQLALDKLNAPFAASPPNYLSILKQLGDLGYSTGTYGLPSGVVGAP